MDENQDYYEILDVSPTATDREIQLAFRQLARQYNPDVNDEPDAAEKLRIIQEAYETLNDPRQRKTYDHLRGQQKKKGASALSLHLVPSQDLLLQSNNEQAYYVLLSVMPAAGLPQARLPLNICLVIDRSTSMKGIRLQQVKEAINRIVTKLQPQDSLGLVVFSDRAQVLLESQHHINPARARAIVSTIQPGGGTEILQGLQAGLKEIERNRSEISVNHIILLTDGQTYGDELECVEQAQWAGSHQVHLSLVGIGSDWNEDLLDEMAGRSNGTSIYIDSPEKTKNIFSETMQNLETVVARELSISVSPIARVSLHQTYQITPYIAPLEAQNNKLSLGSLSNGQEKSVLMEFRIRTPQPGEHRLMRITVESDIPGQAKDRCWEWVEPSITVSDQPIPKPQIPSQIRSAMSKLSIFKMQEKVAADLADGQIEKATERLQVMATQLFNMGEEELSRLAIMEANNIARTSALSPEGSKKMRYGTRALSSNDTPQLTSRLAKLTENLHFQQGQQTGVMPDDQGQDQNRYETTLLKK